jgi:hypothetical protein
MNTPKNTGSMPAAVTNGNTIGNGVALSHTRYHSLQDGDTLPDTVGFRNSICNSGTHCHFANGDPYEHEHGNGLQN